MLPAGLTQSGFYYLRVSCVRGLVTSGLCFKSGLDSHCVFRILIVIFCAVFMLFRGRGGGLPVSGGMGGPFSPVSTVSSVGLPAWGHFVILGWGLVIIGELCPGANNSLIRAGWPR